MISDIKYYIVRTAAAVLCAAVCIPMPAEAEGPQQSQSAVLAQEDIVHVHRGNKDTAGECYTVPVYHVHQGNETDGGACFSPLYHVHTEACGIETRTCSARMTGYRYTGSRMCSCNTHGDFRQHQASVTRYHDCCGTETVTDEWCGCQYCGLQEPAQTNPHTYTVTHCGKDSSSIDCYRLSCDKAADTVDHYDVGCGLEEGRAYGTVKVVDNTPGWQPDKTSVSVTVDDPENVLNGKISGDCLYKGSDGTVLGSSGRDIWLTENGTYYAEVKAEPSIAGSAGYVLGFSVMNIDRTAPVIKNVTADKSLYCRENTVAVEAGDAQPDGSAGSGSEGMQYSFDGGDTWQQGASADIMKNGIYDVKVKDPCGNTASEQIVISNVDRDAPEYRLDMPETWHCGDGSITVRITASDKGAGLADKPYSFDGGKTWTDDPEYTAGSPVEIDIRVRDSIGNEDGEKIELKYTPEDKKGGSGENASSGDTGQVSGTDEEKKEVTSEVKSVAEGIDNSRRRQNGRNGGNEAEMNWAAVPAGESEGWVKKKVTVHTGNGGADVRLSGRDNGTVKTDDRKADLPFYRNETFRTAAASTGAVLGTALLFLAVWIMYRGIRIYNYDGRRYRYMGLAPVVNGVTGYEMGVEQHIREEAYTEKYILRPSLPFLKRHANENLLIKAGSARFTAILEKSMDIDMRDR